MSVAVDDALHLPKARRPKSLGGQGRDPVFSLLSSEIPSTIQVRVDIYPHALVEPAQRMMFSTFEGELSATRTLWSSAYD